MAGKRREYSPQEIDSALLVLAYVGGNTARASEQTGISRHTLHMWRAETHRDRYLELVEREAPKIEALAAQQAREIIGRIGETEHAILDRLSETDEPLTTKELSELAGALQRVTTSKGINTTKLLELTGRPTQVVEHRDPRSELTALAKDLGIVFESTATEISTLALPSQSEPANTRDSVSSSE
jgi:hypothetical protein